MQEELFNPLDKSLCKHCAHRITREISSEGFIITSEEGEDLADEGIDSFIHDACILLGGADLDHIVLECNKFVLTEPVYNGKNNFIRDTDILNKVC